MGADRVEVRPVLGRRTSDAHLALPGTQPQAGGQPQASRTQPQAGNQPEADTQPQAGTFPGPLKREVSEPIEPAEEPLAKRRRKLTESLSDIRGAIVQGADRGLWFSDSAYCHDSVQFLVAELLQILERLAQEETSIGFQGVPRLIAKVSDFLATVFKDRYSFPALQHFKGFLLGWRGWAPSRTPWLLTDASSISWPSSPQMHLNNLT